jgi:hypothetical protein
MDDLTAKVWPMLAVCLVVAKFALESWYDRWNG